MNYRDIKFQVEEDLGFITLNRPEKRNALSMNLMTEVIDLLKSIKKDSRIRVVIIKAEGAAFPPATTFRRCSREMRSFTGRFSIFVPK